MTLENSEELYLNFFRNFMTEEWIRNQVKMMYSKKNQFKEIGDTFNLLPPILKDFTSVWRQLRRAELLGENVIPLSVGTINQQHIGRLLYELSGYYKEDYLRSRLQARDQFEDALWELEVGMALQYTGFEIQFEE